MSRKELWAEATEAAAAVPGFKIVPRGRKYHLRCTERDCTWVPSRPGSDRWFSPLRKHAADLVRYAWAHANRHHPNVPERVQ